MHCELPSYQRDRLLLPWRPDLDVVLVLWQLHTGDPLENLCVGAVVPSESCAERRRDQDGAVIGRAPDGR